MKTKEEYLSKMKMVQYLPEEILQKIMIKSFDKGEMIEMGAFVNGYIWNILDGVVRVTIYDEHKGEYYGEFTVGEWVGVAGCLMNIKRGTVDIEAKTNVIVMRIPLREYIDKYPDKALYLWENIAKASAMEFSKILGGTLAKALLSNEGYFLKHLKENNMKVSYKNTRELSELLNTNLRTLQRILRKLTDDGVIGRSKHEIWVVDEEKLEEILVGDL